VIRINVQLITLNLSNSTYHIENYHTKINLINGIEDKRTMKNNIIHKKAKRISAIAGTVLATAISLTSKQYYDIPKDKYYEKQAPSVSLLRDNSVESLAYYYDFLDNTADTIAARKKDEKTLDSLLIEARKPLEVSLFIYNSENMDSIVNRKLDSLVKVAPNYKPVNEEILAKSILDTINNFTEVVSKNYVYASIGKESNYISDIVNSVGATGFMQWLADGWKEFGEGPFIPNAKNPVKNIRAGIRYYKWMEDEFSKNHPDWNSLTIAEKRDYLSTGFNGGPNLYLNDPYHIINWNKFNTPLQSINHAAKINYAMVKLISRDISFYEKKIQRYEVHKDNPLWRLFNSSL
jgi:hypothetical protein